MKTVFFLLILLTGSAVHAQMMHSHNDYAQKEPFTAAYKEGFQSIEADIFLVDGKLLVGHNLSDLDSIRSLRKLYLEQLTHANRKIQLLIDIKSEPLSTLDALVRLLKEYPGLIRNDRVRFTISGNRPPDSVYDRYPSFIYFDGRPSIKYSQRSLEKVSLISDDYGRYYNRATSTLDTAQMKAAINEAHANKKPFRFWANPDLPANWEFLISLGVDYINTDHIKDLSAYLKQRKGGTL